MTTFEGVLAGIYVVDTPGDPMQSVDEIKAVAGRGLEGDRYAEGEGTFSGNPGAGRQVTLIEREAVDAVVRDYGIELTPGDTRRNLVTEGVSLNHLVGREFRVGKVVLRGVRLSEPCAHLEKLTRAGVRQALIHRGGLRADIIEGGSIKVGDAISVQ